MLPFLTDIATPLKKMPGAKLCHQALSETDAAAAHIGTSAKATKQDIMQTDMRVGNDHPANRANDGSIGPRRLTLFAGHSDHEYSRNEMNTFLRV
jgi:hypothetical protein